jgi:hypothetical protein
MPIDTDFLFIGWLPFRGIGHLNSVRLILPQLEYALRIPAEPSPPPIQDPIDPPENPDVPVREPEPDDPGQIRALVKLLAHPDP